MPPKVLYGAWQRPNRILNRRFILGGILEGSRNSVATYNWDSHPTDINNISYTSPAAGLLMGGLSPVINSHYVT